MGWASLLRWRRIYSCWWCVVARQQVMTQQGRKMDRETESV
jgi:hypothetical protein